MLRKKWGGLHWRLAKFPGTATALAHAQRAKTNDNDFIFNGEENMMD